MAVSYGSIYLCSTIVYVYCMLRFFPFIKRLFQEFIHDKCMIRASNLTFISLIAVVPLSAIVISLFSIFGITEQLFINLQKYLFIQSFPTLHEEMVANLEKFIGNARSIGVVGALFFIIPSILLLNNINSNFNAVWGSPSRETVLEKFITYVSVILVGTVLILAGFSFSYILGTTSEFIEQNSRSFTAVVIQYILPRLMSFLTFFLIIMLVPNGRVRRLRPRHKDTRRPRGRAGRRPYWDDLLGNREGPVYFRDDTAAANVGGVRTAGGYPLISDLALHRLGHCFVRPGIGLCLSAQRKEMDREVS